jgi:hypothetical protein
MYVKVCQTNGKAHPYKAIASNGANASPEFNRHNCHVMTSWNAIDRSDNSCFLQPLFCANGMPLKAHAVANRTDIEAATLQSPTPVVSVVASPTNALLLISPPNIAP